MTPLIFITGSREIWTDGDARTWGFVELQNICADLPLSTIVMHGGDDNSPDVMAQTQANYRGATAHVFHSDGWISGIEKWVQWASQFDVSRKDRSKLMVDMARQWLEYERGPVVVLGLLHHAAQCCEASRRLDLARRAGLWTEARIYTP